MNRKVSPFTPSLFLFHAISNVGKREEGQEDIRNLDVDSNANPPIYTLFVGSFIQQIFLRSLSGAGH